jgi:hypothetical protein
MKNSLELKIKNSNVKDKRFTALFIDKNNKVVKSTHFGLKNPKFGTFIDHTDKTRRKNYIARHEVREKKFYKDPKRASTLSRFILWGNSSNLKQAIEDYKKKYNLL